MDNHTKGIFIGGILMIVGIIIAVNLQEALGGFMAGIGITLLWFTEEVNE